MTTPTQQTFEEWWNNYNSCGTKSNGEYVATKSAWDTASAQSSAARVRELEQENHTLAQRLLVVAGTGKKMLISYGEMEKQNSVLREALEIAVELTENGLIDFKKYGFETDADILIKMKSALEAASRSEKGGEAK